LTVLYLGLGSNIGERASTIAAALRALERPGLRFVRASSLYETEPMGLREQAWFLNAVAEFETILFPRQLLLHIQKVERSLGRVRTVANGPRTIDIDILLYGRAVVRTRELEIPHPRFRERRFVLAPLAELNPKLRDPVTHRTVTDLLAGVGDQSVRAAGELALAARPVAGDPLDD
jgi:2-amino-4-hydroxy-6-hydroxymethyldihydropteridine diphosphokinase